MKYPYKYREHYSLYEGKPCVNETATQCQECLVHRLKWAGKDWGKGLWGDSPHYFARKRKRL